MNCDVSGDNEEIDLMDNLEILHWFQKCKKKIIIQVLFFHLFKHVLFFTQF